MSPTIVAHPVSSLSALSLLEFMSTPKTRWLVSIKWRVKAAPIPEAAPVTIATLLSFISPIVLPFLQSLRTYRDLLQLYHRPDGW